jgi:hypothetical protein
MLFELLEKQYQGFLMSQGYSDTVELRAAFNAGLMARRVKLSWKAQRWIEAKWTQTITLFSGRI